MGSIGVIGVGRLGICTALVLEKAGYNVVCYDVNPAIRDAIKTRILVTPEKGVTEMLAQAKNLHVVDTLDQMLHLDTFFCVVATPSLPDGSYSHKYVDSVADEMIAQFTKKQVSPKLLNICCTTMPGYCDTLQKKFDDQNIPVNVCYNPEFIAQGDILNGFVRPDLLLIGEANKECGDTLEEIYKNLVVSQPHICRMKRKEAEITKISINCFITTKISFANTIGDLCVHEGLNPDRVLAAIGSDSRIGRKYLNWGHGYGGPCFPRDNRALCFYSKGQEIQNRIGEATDATNITHLDFIAQSLAELAKKTGKKLLFRDLAYKPGTTILEESQTLALARKLELDGFTIYVQECPEIKKEVQQQTPFQFLFVDTPVNLDEYLLVDAKLSCLRELIH